MNSLELLVKNKTSNGSIHLEIRDDRDELGILYLTAEQYDKLIQIIRTGCFNKDIDFSINDPYNNEIVEDEDETHGFFSID